MTFASNENISELVCFYEMRKKAENTMTTTSLSNILTFINISE